MKKSLIYPLFFCILAFAVPASADFTKADSAKALADCKGGFMSATVVVEKLNEANANAKAQIGSDIISLVESQTDISDTKSENSEGRMAVSSNYSAASQIRSKPAVILGFQEIGSKQLENGLYEYKGYVCKSNAAKPYLDSLKRYLRDSLNVFKGRGKDESICASANRAIDKMQGWQTILEVLNQVDKSLQSEYKDAYGKIEKECKEIFKKQTVVVIPSMDNSIAKKLGENNAKTAVNNLARYIKEYLINSTLYSEMDAKAISEGQKPRFKCEIEITEGFKSGYQLTAKISDYTTGIAAANKMATVESSLKNQDEHKEASMDIVSKLLKRCGAMSIGEVYDGKCKNGKKEGKGKLTYLNGEFYEGEWKEDKYHGKGRFESPDGYIYEGESKNGQQDGKGKQTLPDGTFYDGDWKKGKFYGKGKFTFANGGVYEGEFRDDYFDGKGKLTFANGDIYEGEWKNSVANGKGKVKKQNGEIYEGEVKDGDYSGKGKLIYPDSIGTVEGVFEYGVFKEGKGEIIMQNGEIYEGEFKDGMPNGKGRAKRPNGDVYEGEFKNGTINGNGKIIGINGSFQEGVFKNGILDEGQGKFIYASDDVYEGEFKNGMANGKGKIIWINGTVYEGEFKNDMPNGKGKRIYSNGGVYEGEFKNGTVNGKGKAKMPNGNVYEGGFKNDDFDGQGKLIMPNGSFQEGVFKNGILEEGQGKLIMPNGSAYEGEFKNGTPNGKGKAKAPNGEVVYDGEIKNGDMEGKGTLTLNGEVYVGEFKNNMKNGRGKLTKTNGEVCDGEWKNNIFQGNDPCIGVPPSNVLPPPSPTPPQPPPSYTPTYEPSSSPTSALSGIGTAKTSSATKSGKSFYVATAFDIIGVGLLAYGFVMNMEAEKLYKDYKNKKSGSPWDFENAWYDADDAKSARNVLYLMGGAFLATGIGIHIVF